MSVGDSSDAERLFDEIKRTAQLPAAVPTAGVRELTSNYEFVEEIHRGGQGVVFKALQIATKRLVAVKLILHGSFASERQRYRFEREIDIASQLRHPNIVTIFDGGISASQPYCVMEFVDGKNLGQVNSVERSTESKRQLRHRQVQLFKTVCQAVGYAHARGVIHRDLKPANILVQSDSGEPKILDFGLAKSIDQQIESPHFPHTMTGEFLGTLRYASPEQAIGKANEVDTRSDVYSLGVIFYEMLVGAMPYEVDGSLVETLNVIATKEPMPPSSQISSIDADLETILLKCLAKDPERRYQNASLLGKDLQRYLEGAPVDARRDSGWYVFRKMVIRHRTKVFVAAAVLALLIGSLVAISYYYFQAVADRDAATEAKNNESKLRIKETEQRKIAEFRTYVARISAAYASVRSFAAHDVLRNLYRAPQEHRGWEYWYVFGQNDLSKSTLGFANRMQYGHHDQIVTVDFHPSKKWVISGARDGSVVVWDTESESPLAIKNFAEGVSSVEFHPRRNLIAVGFFGGGVELMKISNLSENNYELLDSHQRFETDGRCVNETDFSPSKDWLLVASGEHDGRGGIAYIFDVKTTKLVKQYKTPREPVLCATWSHSGELIAYAGSQLTIRDSDSSKIQHDIPAHQNWVNSISFRNDDKHVVTSANEPVARVWGVQSGRLLKSLYGHSSFVNTAQYSPDGSLIATGSSDSTLRIWNARNAEPLQTLWGQYSGIWDLAFFSDNQTVATCGTWSVKTWNVVDNKRGEFGTQFHNRILDFAIDSKSKRIFTADHLGCIQEFDLSDKSLTDTIAPVAEDRTPAPPKSLEISPDDKFLVWVSDSGEIELQDRNTGTLRTLHGPADSVTSVCFAEGNELFSVSEDGAIRKWNLFDRTSKICFQYDSPLKKVAASRCKKWLGVSSVDEILVLDRSNMKIVLNIPRKRRFASDGFDFAFHPEGIQLAAPVSVNAAYVWNLPSGELAGQLVEHSQPVVSVAYSPSGNRVATSSREGTVKLWDSKYFQVVLTLQGYNSYARVVRFSPNEQHLIGGLYDGTIKIWEAMPEDQRQNGPEMVNGN